MRLKCTIVFFVFIFSIYASYSQIEDFSIFFMKFSKDSIFQKERVVFPIPQISWDYEKDDEKTVLVQKDDYHYQRIFNLNSECADGFYFFYPNNDTLFFYTDMVLQISGITDMYVKYYFKLIDNKWFLVKYLDYDLDL